MNIKKAFPYVQFLASVIVIFTYFGWTAGKLMSTIWIKEALKWSLLFGLFYYSIYSFYITQKKDWKINKLEEKQRKFMTSFSNAQNGIMRRLEKIEERIKTIR